MGCKLAFSSQPCLCKLPPEKPTCPLKIDGWVEDEISFYVKWSLGPRGRICEFSGGPYQVIMILVYATDTTFATHLKNMLGLKLLQVAGSK